MTSPDASAAPPYLPAPYLIDGPGAFLTSAELVRYFNDFYASLGCVNTAPQMVFERLIGNLGGPVRAALEQARRAGADGANESCITSLQAPATAFLRSVVLPAVILPPVVSPITAVPTTLMEQEVHRTPQHVIRSFNVGDCPEWLASTDFPSTRAFVTGSSPDLSRFAIALTSLRVADSAQLIVSANITTPQDTGFTVSLTNAGPPGSSSCLKNASCSWLELGDDAKDMQCGVWTLPKYDVPKWFTTHQINFRMRYNVRPQVLVWLKGLNMSSSLRRSVELTVESVNCSSFTLKVTSLDSAIHSVQVSWLACPMSRQGVSMESFYAGQQDCTYNASGLREGYVSFERSRFKAIPKVVVGMQGFTMEEKSNLSLSVQVVHVSTQGMKWRFDGGPDGRFTYVKGSFIAFE